MQREPPSINIIILNWNGIEDTIECLDSIGKLTYPNVQAIVVDNGSKDDQAKEIVAKMQEHVRDISGLLGHSILSEEGGRMVILLTDWPNRQDCLTYHSSRAYRQLVASTQHMLIGNYVVKLFTNLTDMA